MQSKDVIGKLQKFPYVAALISVVTGIYLAIDKQAELDRKTDIVIKFLEDIQIPKTEPEPEPTPPPKPAQNTQKKLIMHTMRNCIWCNVDKRQNIPRFIAAGYNIEYIDEGWGIPGSTYPWYEIFDGVSPGRPHVGSLGNLRP